MSRSERADARDGVHEKYDLKDAADRRLACNDGARHCRHCRRVEKKGKPLPFDHRIIGRFRGVRVKKAKLAGSARRLRRERRIEKTRTGDFGGMATLPES